MIPMAILKTDQICDKFSLLFARTLQLYTNQKN